MKAIFTRYHGPGNTASRRVSATDKDGNRIYSQWDDGLAMDDNHDAAAKALCVKCGWTDAPLIRASVMNDGYVYVFVNSSQPITFTVDEQAQGKANHARRTKAIMDKYGLAGRAYGVKP